MGQPKVRAASEVGSLLQKHTLCAYELEHINRNSLRQSQRVSTAVHFLSHCRPLTRFCAAKMQFMMETYCSLASGETERTRMRLRDAP